MFICFLSMDDMGDYVSDDGLAIEPLRSLGWETETVSWREKQVDWSRYEAVIIRTPWDYQDDPEKFLKVLADIESTGTLLENPLEIVKWNLSKTYLDDLSKKGIRIVPTIWPEGPADKAAAARWFRNFHTDELIIKPVISATAGHTYRFRKFLPELTGVFRNRKYMVQAFMDNIAREGEFSLFFFAGEFSHAILKTPVKDDFRVQEEFGGTIVPVSPEKKLKDAAQRVLRQIECDFLYSRLDFVRDNRGEFALMELELIEPSLYLRMDKDAPERFALAFHRRMNEL